MPRKAKKRVHPMPPLGWKDQLVYWLGILLTAGFSIGSFIIAGTVQDQIAFSDPNVMARIDGPGNLGWVWILFWMLLAFCFILTGPYQHRFPIFGRSDLQYGPPAYPRVYPLFMKNKPKHWVSPKELEKRKKRNRIIAIFVILSFLLSLFFFFHAFHGRTVLQNDGAIRIYNGFDREVKTYEPEDIDSLELKVYSYKSKNSPRRWNICFRITTSDSETYRIPVSAFRGTKTEKLQAMFLVKEQIYRDIPLSIDPTDLHRVHYFDAPEIPLLNQLFEVTS